MESQCQYGNQTEVNLVLKLNHKFIFKTKMGYYSTGSAVVGSMVAGFTYARVENKFTLTSEPRISLQADIDFYSGVKLCMKLDRPDMILK